MNASWESLVSLANRPNFDNIRVSQKELDLYFEQDFCFRDVESVVMLQELVLSYFKMFFGVNESTVSNELIDLITEKIKIKYPSITFSQIKYAFLSQEVEKKAFTSGSTDEFTKYLKFWEQKEKQIKLALAEVEQMEQKKAQEEQNRINFENKCREIYSKSIEAGEWLGDKYEAKWVLANMDVTNNISSETKRAMWYASLDKAKEEIRQEESSYFKFVEGNYVNRVKARREQIYAEMLINEIFK